MARATHKPLHERIWLLGALRQRLRGVFFRFLNRVAETDDAKSIQVSCLNNLLPRRTDIGVDDSLVQEVPYADLGKAPATPPTCCRDDVVIITARFRSGSTLLWNLFRALPGCTAYYEPLNERRWFDPVARGSRIDPTHRGVDEYWSEYEGLTELGQYYQEKWVSHHLWMDADSWDPAMKRYVEILMERSRGRPVLQFNRIDFRLPWFRCNFPRARIVHLYRHPRDQWCSSLVDPRQFPCTATMADFATHDRYYLRMWAQDLKYHFPFLAESAVAHPYQMFYYIWKLSYLYGRQHAHVSLGYEDLLKEPERCLTQLFSELDMPCADLTALTRLVEKPRPARWREYASEDWFRQHESFCEAVMADFFQSAACQERSQPPGDRRSVPIQPALKVVS